MILTRLSVWFGEMVSALLFLSVLSLTLAGRSEQWSRCEDFALVLVWTAAVFMFGSGFLVTTGVVGVFFRSQSQWCYPTVAALLFIAHDQFFYTGLKVPDTAQAQYQVAGGCIVFICTSVGTWYLRKWGRAMGHHPGGQRANTADLG